MGELIGVFVFAALFYLAMRIGFDPHVPPGNGQRTAQSAKLVLYYALAAFGLNLAWEAGQLPLYTLRFEPDAGKIVRWVLHCTLGDVLIALSAFGLAALSLRDPRWPLRAPVRGMVFATLSGLAFTAFSEWRNVYVLGAWAYTDDMPLVFGLGLAPLLQWLLVPAAVLIVVRGVLSRPRRQICAAAPATAHVDPHALDSSHAEGVPE